MTSMETLLKGSSMTSNKSRYVGQSYYFFCMCVYKLNSNMNLNVLLFCLNCQMFKGPNQDIEAVYTAPSSAVCGVTLETNGKEYLITGTTVTAPHITRSLK